ncbi:COX15/CtaA family protein [Wenjunlia tyrosinilytica]|uniref:Cytochrome b561 n=1 Tax=Wenjunlia tyrosinilytica TaxID=1544741 RepID=A0A917ZGG4_9ACTN|nr:COX15/CtaA family protein [Wenjunlia tyrosinilytica]GGO81407.1 cytochrome b561 [Wenjunlia tyrosinilytica]
MLNSLNPFAAIARRRQPSAAFVERAALATVVMSVVIVVTGGAVRLTESGLGCPTWPTCTAESLTPTGQMGIHGAIEFGNRMLTYVLCAAVGLAIVAARARSPWRRDLTRLGWAQFWIVMSNAVVGGVTVLTGLNPYIVGSHFLISSALITVAVLMWKRAGEGSGPARPLVAKPVGQLTWGLVAATGALIVVGTVVTGAGPHAGDAKKVHRIPLDWERVTQLHVDLVFLVLGVSLALLFVLRATGAPAAARARCRDLLVVLLAQGVVGFVQYFTHLPELVVGAHMLGSGLVWIAVLRLALALRERPVEEPGAADIPGPVKDEPRLSAV